MSEDRIIKLRPHHLLCLQGFSGKGYSKDFVSNMTKLKEDLFKEDAMINLAGGSDDICAKCPHLLMDGLCQTEKKVKTKDDKVVKYFGLGHKLYDFGALVNDIKNKITPSIMADICGDCAWYDNSHCRKNILGQVTNQDTREIIFKLIFERVINSASNEDTFLMLTEVLDAENLKRARMIYDETGADKKGAFIDDLIEKYACEFKADRVFKVDMAILIVAIYEILFDELSHKIAANEAVLLAKKYSSEKSSKFINGVLSSIIKEKETILNEYKCKNS